MCICFLPGMPTAAELPLRILHLLSIQSETMVVTQICLLKHSAVKALLGSMPAKFLKPSLEVMLKLKVNFHSRLHSIQAFKIQCSLFSSILNLRLSLPNHSRHTFLYQYYSQTATYIFLLTQNKTNKYHHCNNIPWTCSCFLSHT